jgi:short-subunit dehydrogenase
MRGTQGRGPRGADRHSLGRFEEIPLADHVKVVETDLLGTLYGSYYAMRQFRQQGSGTLINISSVLGKVPGPYYASYVAAKYGVVGLEARCARSWP